MQSETKNCQNCKKDFVIEPDDFGFYEQMKVPPPVWCPQCRLLRRMNWYSYRILYKRKCDFTGENIITIYHPDLPYKVYKQDIWWSDKWDPKSYGREYDFSRPFFEQFKEFLDEVPKAALHTEYTTMINSEYCNAASYQKNGYLCFKHITGEDSAYTNVASNTKDSLDVAYSLDPELCYEIVDCRKCFQVFFSQDCENCQNIYFSRDLMNCGDCFGCTSLRNKNYCIFNQQYSKVDYDKSMAGFSFCDEAKVLETEKKLEELKLKSPRQAMMALNCENVTGNYIFNCKNCSDCFSISRNEDCNYNIQTVDNKDCYDMNYTEENELCYEYLGNYRNHTALFCAFPYGCHDIWYCDYVTNCKHCFGCVAIKNREYCILNKQYSKDEYFELKDRLVAMMKEGGEFGEFFPVNISPFAYNESVAYDYFPFTKEEVLKRGYRFRDEDKSEFQPTSYVPPVDIKDVPDSICNEILSCEISGRNYKITPAELKFYRLMKLPIPRKHFIERHKARLAKRLPYELFDRKCGKCGVEIKTAYKPDTVNGHSASLRVCCEKCYLETVY